MEQSLSPAFNQQNGVRMVLDTDQLSILKVCLRDDHKLDSRGDRGHSATLLRFHKMVRSLHHHYYGVAESSETIVTYYENTNPRSPRTCYCKFCSRDGSVLVQAM